MENITVIPINTLIQKGVYELLEKLDVPKTDVRIARFTYSVNIFTDKRDQFVYIASSYNMHQK